MRAAAEALQAREASSLVTLPCSCDGSRCMVATRTVLGRFQHAILPNHVYVCMYVCMYHMHVCVHTESLCSACLPQGRNLACAVIWVLHMIALKLHAR